MIPSLCLPSAAPFEVCWSWYFFPRRSHFVYLRCRLQLATSLPRLSSFFCFLLLPIIIIIIRSYVSIAISSQFFRSGLSFLPCMSYCLVFVLFILPAPCCFCFWWCSSFLASPFTSLSLLFLCCSFILSFVLFIVLVRLSISFHYLLIRFLLFSQCSPFPPSSYSSTSSTFFSSSHPIFLYSSSLHRATLY